MAAVDPRFRNTEGRLSAKIDITHRKQPSVLSDAEGYLNAELKIEVATGSKGYTTETGGEATLKVSLTHEPRSPVFFMASVTKPSEAGLATQTDLVFTKDNYAEGVLVTVTGRGVSARGASHRPAPPPRRPPPRTR